MTTYQNTFIEGRTVIPACDVELPKFLELVEATKDLPKIGGYKIPATSGYDGWKRWADEAKQRTTKPLIYDHQKGGTDIPDTGSFFMKQLRRAGVDAVILFPLAGPKTQAAWTEAAMEKGLYVLVGGEMTHPQFKRSDGGYIADEALEEIYANAARQGVRHFVVPGNKLDRISVYKRLLEDLGADPIFFSPGLVKQGGDISEAAKIAGNNWHGIVGTAIYTASDIRKAAEELTSKL